MKRAGNRRVAEKDPVVNSFERKHPQYCGMAALNADSPCGKM